MPLADSVDKNQTVRNVQSDLCCTPSDSLLYIVNKDLFVAIDLQVLKSNLVIW